MSAVGQAAATSIEHDHIQDILIPVPLRVRPHVIYGIDLIKRPSAHTCVTESDTAYIF